MKPRSGLQKAELLEKVSTEASLRLDKEKEALFDPFFRRFYKDVPEVDLLGQVPAKLFGAAYAMLKFAELRASGESLVRVITPRLDEHGWRSDHSVIEMINDDMPFLVDSVCSFVTSHGLTIHMLSHPVIQTRRDDSGKLRDVLPNAADKKGWIKESFIHIQITRLASPSRRQALEEGLNTVLADVRASVGDWKTMCDAMARVIAAVKVPPPNVNPEHAAEVREFLQWLHRGNFAFLGYRDYEFSGPLEDAKVKVIEDQSLGVLRVSKQPVLRRLIDGRSLPIELSSFVNKPDLMMLTKANMRSRVHRTVHMDTLCIKKFDDGGRPVGLQIFAGLFTASAYYNSPLQVPLLSAKIKRVMEKSGLSPDGHDGMGLRNVFETFPRDELFQIADEDLLEIGMGILNLKARSRVALFVRRDDFERFVSCLVFIPRDLYATKLRRVIQEILEGAFEGETAAYYIQVSDTPLARLHCIVRTEPGRELTYDLADLERRIVEAARSWPDVLKVALIDSRGEEEGLRLHMRYGEAFPPGYTGSFGAETALEDIACLEQTSTSDEMVMSLYRPIEAGAGEVRLKTYRPGGAVSLSDSLPILEHMGFRVMDEIPYKIKPLRENGKPLEKIMIHDFGLKSRDNSVIDLGAVREKFRDALRRIWDGDVESDGFNALVLSAGLNWREVVVIRAYSKYLRQAAIPFSQVYMEQTLTANAELARLMIDLFNRRFDPVGDKNRQTDCETLKDKIQSRLEAVVSADQDRILRRFVNVIEATLRTNFFQKDDNGNPKPYVSFKLDSTALDDLPPPRPWREIFVYSPRVEAIHLRGGKVARGGLRWSDRPEDFRTEVLNLAKAQQVKNAVIVPVGSKGGFVVKQPPIDGGRQALMEEGIACYKIFISALLDITDNMEGKTVIAPADVVRYDDDDPYLVVAADKGTATFSDIANSVSEAHGFWLGDAFASGGTYGYDHKKMAITARGAWESVKRHFREMGIDTQSTDFTVVGVGDMGGDVFGNGMLLSQHIRLVAAFNHLHIFVDPDPDPATSFHERSRLFDAEKGWEFYDTQMISDGGGVFSRASKRLTVSRQICKLLSLESEVITPNDLIRAILSAQVDLLWFGGIGTYVKAKEEIHADTGDRANDAVRIDAPDLGCKVIGEGANLGITQRGRIQFALAGGRLNKDSVDNSGGVDCSDHEVNIKILIDQVVGAGDLTRKQRNAFLARMTDEVAELVLRDNYLQSQALGLLAAQGSTILEPQARLMRMLERGGRLDRALEFLPDDETLSERAAASIGLTKPEISILISYSKIWLYDALLESDLPDDSALAVDLLRYFPSPLRKKFGKAIVKHRLRREIVATRVTNSLINRVGGHFIAQLVEKTGTTADQVARAYIIVRDVFGLHDIWADIEALDSRVAVSVQIKMMLEINLLIDRGVMWLLRNASHPLNIGDNIDEFASGVGELAEDVASLLTESQRLEFDGRKASYSEHKVPEPLAHRMAGVIVLVSGCDIVRLSHRHGLSVKEAARHYMVLGARFNIGSMRAAAEQLRAETHWEQLAVDALIVDLYGHQVALTAQIIEAGAGAKQDAQGALAAWSEAKASAIERTDQLLGELWSSDMVDLPKLTVASQLLRALAEPTASADGE